jgi:2-polyprenyl-3-methyl-5-hydroxy-6-metoxy-1,4-benzoquinol methylase
MNKKDKGWWTDFFDDFRPVFSEINAKKTNAEARYLIKKLNLKPGSKFLDCPCGIGRISIPMAKKGIRVTGVDITKSYLNELAKKAKRGGLNIGTVHRDMRRIDFDSQFDAAGNLWTSFGYFQKESDNRLVLKKIFKALKPGGKFALDILNRDWIMANYVPRGWHYAGNSMIVEDRNFDFRTSIIKGIWHIIKDGKMKSFDTYSRLYSFHELVVMFEKAGFVNIEGFGSMKDESISQRSRVMYIFGTKPK